MKRSPMTQLAAALLIAAALPAAAQAAEGVSYNYVEGGHAATRNEYRDAFGTKQHDDANGGFIAGSAAIAPNFHLFGSYSKQELDDSDIDFDQWRVGVGYNHQIAPAADLLTRVAYEKFDAGSDIFGNDIEADGWSVEAGVRAGFTPNFEGYALAGYEDGEDFGGNDRDGDFYGRVGAQVKFNQTWGINGDVKFVDGDTQYFVGPRISF